MNKSRLYRLHSMHGPTVHAYSTLTKALDEMMRQKQSNGGEIRIIQDGSTFVLASLSTYHTTSILNAEQNAEMRARKAGKDAA